MPWTDQSSSFLRLLDYIWYTDIFPNQQKKEFNTGTYLLFSTWWSLYWFSSIVILCDQLPCVSLIYVFYLIRQIRYNLSCVVFETLARAISTFITLDGFLANTFLYSEAVQHCGRLIHSKNTMSIFGLSSVKICEVFYEAFAVALCFYKQYDMPLTWRVNIRDISCWRDNSII